MPQMPQTTDKGIEIKPTPMRELPPGSNDDTDNFIAGLGCRHVRFMNYQQINGSSNLCQNDGNIILPAGSFGKVDEML